MWWAEAPHGQTLGPWPGDPGGGTFPQLPRPSRLDPQTKRTEWARGGGTPELGAGLLLPKLTAWMGAQPAPLPCTLPPLLGAGEQPAPHPGNKLRGIRRITVCEVSGKSAHMTAAG